MSKRPISSHSDHRSKRQHIHDQRGNGDGADGSTQALMRLAEQADELVHCLQSLKRQLLQDQNATGPQLDETQQRLSRLSKHLLPSFEALASVDERATTNPSPGDALTLITPGVPVPPSIAVTPWASSEIKPDWPLLPPILDPDLAEEAFTHPGLGRKRNYERLEWLGDAYLELIATALIHQTFGQLPSGRCSQLRERLVRNVNLAEYFRHYDMSKWAKLPGEFSDGTRGLGRGRSSDKDLLKTQADMFEAYVAAVILSDPQNGLSNVVEWLKGLWGRTIEDEIKKAEAAKDKDNGNGNTNSNGNGNTNSKESELKGGAEVKTSSAKERLNQKIVVKGVAVRYKDLPCEKKDKLGLPLYSVGAYLDGWGETGRLLGVGTALSKKEAGQKAADTALQNKRLMKAYEEKKWAYMQARADA